MRRVNLYLSDSDGLALDQVAADQRAPVGTAARGLLVRAVEVYLETKRRADESENAGGFEQLNLFKKSRGKK